MSAIIHESTVQLADGIQASVKIVNDYGTRGYAKKARVYVWGTDRVDTEAHELLEASIAADDPKTWNPLNRKLHAIQKQYLAQVFTASPMPGMDLVDVERFMKWSAKGGCSCGCSPAFVYQGVHWGHSYEVFIELSRPEVSTRTFTMDELDPARV
jgi:hypothetical protein